MGNCATEMLTIFSPNYMVVGVWARSLGGLHNDNGVIL